MRPGMTFPAKHHSCWMLPTWSGQKQDARWLPLTGFASLWFGRCHLFFGGDPVVDGCFIMTDGPGTLNGLTRRSSGAIRVVFSNNYQAF